MTSKPAMYSTIKNVGGFLSDYFLSNILNEKSLRGKLGENEVNSAYRSFLSLFRRRQYELGDNTSQDELYRKWIKPILQRLGFEPKKKTYVESDKGNIPISAIEYEEGRPLVIFKFLKFGHSPDISENGRRPAQKELMKALYYEKVKWGIITNGKIFRLLRNSPITADNAYLEIDLWNILESEDRDSFRIFWALFRRAAFEPIEDGKCLLDIIEEESRKHAVSVGDELRQSIFRVLERFIRGVLENEENEGKINDLEALYQESLVYLYRILFILYAESIGLLPVDNPLYRESYSLESIRELVTDPKMSFEPNSYYIWESLKAIFRLIDRGFEGGGLKVPAYNGRLFHPDSTPILSKCRVSDDVMAEVLRDLMLTSGKKGRTRDIISYRELGIDQLGSIYESLLELEPKIAEEDLAVVKIKGELQYVPKSRLKGEKVEEEIPAGTFYLAAWGGRRKSSGTYYTPKQITRFLVRQALEPLVEGKSSEEILQIKVVDPAMGSGAFLVAAVEFLAEKYKEALIREGVIDKDEIDAEREAEFKRLVLENCIYGVDVNPMAVELAKVSLWLVTMAKEKPLTFLDHKLKCGNSLIGADHERVRFVPNEIFKQLKDRDRRKHNQAVLKRRKDELQTFWTKDGEIVQNPFRYLEDVIRLRQELSFADDTVEAVKLKEEKYAKFVRGEIGEGKLYLKLKNVYDLWTALWFIDEGKDGVRIPTTDEYIEVVRYILEGGEGNERFDRLIRKAGELAGKYHFFHWELEFPEVFAEGGFDAVVGNPPWDIVKPNSDEFFSNYDPYFRGYTKRQKNKVMKELMEENEEIKRSWEEYVSRIEKEAFFFKNSGFYPHQYKGDINLYKLFLERFFWLIREGGRMSIIVPSGLYTDEGCKELRKMFLENSRIEFLIGIENREGIFPIHRSFKFTLLSTLKKKQEGDYRFKVGFFIGSRPDDVKKEVLDAETILKGSFAPKAEELENLLPLVLEKGLEISRDLIEKFSPDTLSIMEFKRQADIDLAEKIYDDWPLLGDSDERWAWNVKFTTEFHMTNDSHLFVTKEQLEKMGAKPLDGKGLRWVVERDGMKEIYLPLYEGKMIWQFDAFYERPQYWVSEESGKSVLNKKSSKDLRRAYKFYRLCFRDVARSTDARTAISTIIPKTFHGNNLPSIILDLTNHAESYLTILYLTSWFNSITGDFVVRQKVTAHLNFHFVKTFPIPRLTSGNWFFDQIVPRAARLICIDEEFAELWEETFKPEWREIAKTSKVKGWKNLTQKWTPECGVYGWGYINNEKRDDGDRAQLRAEIDALVAHLYGLTKDEFAYILDTFPVLKRKEEEAFGEFRTKRVCLEEYDRFAAIIGEEKKKYPEKFDLSRFKKSYVKKSEKEPLQAKLTKNGKIAKIKGLDSFFNQG